jgi:hypothetical protein
MKKSEGMGGWYQGIMKWEFRMDGVVTSWGGVVMLATYSFTMDGFIGTNGYLAR